MKGFKYFIALAFLPIFFFACEGNADEISSGMDHEVPQAIVLTDSLEVELLQKQIELKVQLSDNKGLKKLSFSYGDWNILEAVELSDSPKDYVFSYVISEIPLNAAKEWEEIVTLNTGATKTVTQTYHKLQLVVTDVNMNVCAVPVCIKVK